MASIPLLVGCHRPRSRCGDSKGTSVTPAVEPLSLRLPRDLLVLQPMQGHLDVEPVLLAPGLRCVIGSAEGCAIRLTKSALVQPEHCVVEVIGRQTLLTKWIPETTWLNDRLLSEPRELVAGDRIAVGPFDFRVRPASADELLYAKLVERDSSDSNQIEDVLRLKRAIDNSGRDPKASLSGTGTTNEPTLDLFNDLLRETNDGAASDSHERLTQHISKLFGDLQSQILALQEKEAELNEQLRSQRDESQHSQSERQLRVSSASQASQSSTPLIDTLPPAVRPEYEHVLQLLKAERDQLDHDRAQLADEQTRWHEQQREWSLRLQTLESQLAELETQRQAVFEERDICRTLASELMRDEARLADWENRLHHEEQELVRRQEDFRQREQAPPVPQKASPLAIATRPAPIAAASAGSDLSTHRAGQAQISAKSDATAPTGGRPLQTLMTLAAFSLAAFFLSGTLGKQDAHKAIGWGTAILGAISTVDLLFRRGFSSQR